MQGCVNAPWGGPARAASDVVCLRNVVALRGRRQGFTLACDSVRNATALRGRRQGAALPPEPPARALPHPEGTRPQMDVIMCYMLFGHALLAID